MTNDHKDNFAPDNHATTLATTRDIREQLPVMRHMLFINAVFSCMLLSLLPLAYIILRRTDTAMSTQKSQLIQSHSIVENIPIGLYIFHLENPDDDHSLVLSYSNPVNCIVPGSVDIIGKSFDDTFLGLRKQNACKRYAEITRTQAAQTFEEFIYDDDNVLIAAFSVKAFPLPGRNVGVAFENITDRKKTDQVLLETNRKLEAATVRAERMADQAQQGTVIKSQFLANMSHELRTPLNGILSMTRILLDSDLDNNKRRYTEIIYNSGNLLLNIINDILDFSKIQAGQITLSPQEFNLQTDLLDDIIHMMMPLASEKKLSFHCTIDPDVPLPLYGDLNRLRQILINLVGNAIKFTNIGEVAIHVSVEKSSGNDVSLHFSVRDTGIGIPGDQIASLFNKFTQVDTSPTRQFGGTGLGLSISKQLVELMDGRIGVNSNDAAGSEFWFTVTIRNLPFSCVPACTTVSHLTSPSTTASSSVSGKHILIAEDNPVNQQVMVIMLKKLGLIVHAACNGEEAVKMLESTPCDCILMDCQMPVMDGYEATRKIRSSDSQLHDIPIIAITAHASQDDREKCMLAGMNDYIAKPVLPATLLKILDGIFSDEKKPMQTDHTNAQPQIPITGNRNQIWNRTALLDRVMNDEEITVKIAEEFVAAIPRLRTTLEEAVRGKDLKAIERQAHTIKGAAGIVGADVLHLRASDMELAAKSGNVEAISAELHAVITEFDRVKDAIENVIFHL